MLGIAATLIDFILNLTIYNPFHFPVGTKHGSMVFLVASHSADYDVLCDDYIRVRDSFFYFYRDFHICLSLMPNKGAGDNARWLLLIIEIIM